MILDLNGIFVPNVTPFDRQGEVDYETLRRLVDFWLDAGVSGLVVNASTGEGPLLSDEEQVSLLELVLERVHSKARVLAGTGGIGTRETIRQTRCAKDCGAEAALVVTPYFYRPSDDELLSHYASLIASVDLPVVIYNVPKFTGYSIKPRVVERIADECSGLVGLKDSSGDQGLMAEFIRLVGNRINVLSGNGDLVLSNLVLGGKGGIVAIANVIPRTCVTLYEAFKKGQLDEAGRLQLRASHVNRVLVRDHSQISAIKAAMNSVGRPAGFPRQPLRTLPQKEEEEILKELKDVELK